MGPRKYGTNSPALIPLSTAWLLRQDQGRSTLGKVLQSIKTSDCKRRVLQSLAGVFPCNAILFKMKISRLAEGPALQRCERVSSAPLVSLPYPQAREDTGTPQPGSHLA